MTILGIGPYIGDFRQEFLTFRPYAQWLSEVVEHDNVYLSTHRNRSFLYDFIPDENILPVYENFSRNEDGQKGYIHSDLQQKDFNLLTRKFKEEIIERESCSRRDIELHHLNYTKTTPHYSIYNKVFNRISTPNDINIPEEHKNKIIFIPVTSESQQRSSIILSYLREKQDFIVVGDSNTWFTVDNVVLSNIDYFENGWKYIINYIIQAKGIICPTSYWTAICNLQRKPIFSWGASPGQYREDGIYYFGNKKSTVIPADIDTDPTIIIKMMEHFIKGLK